MQIVINDLLIDYHERKTAGGKCLLFLHGWRSKKEVWANIVNQVIKLSSFQVYALDLPGFGQSQMPKNPHPSPLPKGEGGWSVGDYTELVAEFIRKLDLKQVIIVGHSFGGRVGIKLASRNPELLSKLVLVDSAGFVMPSSRKSFYSAAAKVVKPIFKPRFMQGLRRKIYQKIGAEDYVATPELQQTFIKVVSEDLTEDMKRITAPVLIIFGENDKDTPVEFGKRMQSLIPNSKFVILPQAGHFSFLDQPEEFVEILKNFI